MAKEPDWLKKEALLPGHRPSIKDVDPLKLKQKQNNKKERNVLLSSVNKSEQLSFRKKR